jgi:hypothetical protein
MLQELFSAIPLNELLGCGNPFLFGDQRFVFLAEDGVDLLEAVERIGEDPLHVVFRHSM